MDDRYAYLVCQMQNSRIVFVNGQWQGTLPMADTSEAMASCPLVWDYLRGAGDDGWELIGTVALTTTTEGVFAHVASNLFLKKAV
ncbi:MAG: hypothetical protein LC754_07125 [Acidobacteria bacterium]|nr:hypothetical protein [Acidobacteriota bacterium]